jgi:hypothetical protein
MRGDELGRNGEVGRSRRCGEVESGLEMEWPELGRWRLAAAAAVVRVEWIQSERIEGGARLGFTFPSGLSVSVQRRKYPVETTNQWKPGNLNLSLWMWNVRTRCERNMYHTFSK